MPASVSDSRIKYDSGDAHAEYLFEVTQPDGKTLKKWLRWKECVAVSEDLKRFDVRPLSISPKRVLLSMKRDATLSDEYIEDRRRELAQWVKVRRPSNRDSIHTALKGSVCAAWGSWPCGVRRRR